MGSRDSFVVVSRLREKHRALCRRAKRRSCATSGASDLQCKLCIAGAGLKRRANLHDMFIVLVGCTDPSWRSSRCFAFLGTDVKQTSQWITCPIRSCLPYFTCQCSHRHHPRFNQVEDFISLSSSQ